MNSVDMGLSLEHCLQLCREAHRLQVRGCAREGWHRISHWEICPVDSRIQRRPKLSFALLGHT